MGSDNKPILATTPPDIGTPQVNWDRKKFDDVIYNHGNNAYIERTLACPCRVKGLGQPQVNCINCGGTGYFMIDKISTKLLCQSLSNKKGYINWTAQNQGLVSITSRPEDKLGWMDRVTLIDLRSWFNEVVYPKKFNDGSSDKMFAFLIYPPLEIFHVYKFDTPSSHLILLNKSQYSIDKNKIILADSFLSQENISLTIRYAHAPAYHIIDINRDLIKQPSGKDCDTGIIKNENMPLHCIGRRAHFMLDAPDFSGNRVPDNTDYELPPINYDI